MDFVKRYASEGEENKVKKPLRFPVFLIVLPYTLQNYLLLLPLLIMLQDSRVGRFITLSCVFFLGPFFTHWDSWKKASFKKHSQAASSFFFVTIVIFSSLSRTTPQEVLSVLPPLAATALLGILGLFTAGLVTNRLFFPAFSPLRESWRDLHLWFSYNDACLSGSIRCHGKK